MQSSKLLWQMYMQRSWYTRARHAQRCRPPVQKEHESSRLLWKRYTQRSGYHRIWHMYRIVGLEQRSTQSSRHQWQGSTQSSEGCHGVGLRSRQKMRDPNILQRGPEVSDNGALSKAFTWQEPTGVSMLVPAWFGAVKTAAVVDTAAQVTIMNSNLHEKLGLKPGSHDETVLLRNAKRDSTMWGVVWKHVGLQSGERKYFWDIVEANISDASILGIDFFRWYRHKIDLGSSVFYVYLEFKRCELYPGNDCTWKCQLTQYFGVLD